MSVNGEGFVRSCESAGLDLVHSFGTAWFNADAVDSERLPDFGRGNALAWVVGNTRRFWPVVQGAVQRDLSLSGADHPIDAYVMRSLGTAAAELAARSVVLFGHIVEPRAIPIQRIAERAGLAHLGPSHLSVHPHWGPWFALRAVVVVDADGPSSRPQVGEPPCFGCAAPCLGALARALEESSGVALGSRSVAARWRSWLSVRDECPVGREHRYSDAQVEYHYTKRKALLLE